MLLESLRIRSSSDIYTSILLAYTCNPPHQARQSCLVGFHESSLEQTNKTTNAMLILSPGEEDSYLL